MFAALITSALRERVYRLTGYFVVTALLNLHELSYMLWGCSALCYGECPQTRKPTARNCLLGHV